MYEIRYLKIESCVSCPYTGHTTSKYDNKVTHICVYPENMEMDRHKKELNGVLYPITYITEQVKHCPIPHWCNLPNMAQKR